MHGLDLTGAEVKLKTRTAKIGGSCERRMRLERRRSEVRADVGIHGCLKERGQDEKARDV